MKQSSLCQLRLRKSRTKIQMPNSSLSCLLYLAVSLEEGTKILGTSKMSNIVAFLKILGRCSVKYAAVFPALSS